MRTLKKTLSLVLVVAMVLGLCVVGASAKNAVDDFTDADKIGDAYYEAVGVMTGIGVIKGMGDGILSPTGNYTRAQAAKIITYMLIGEKAAESLVCTTAPFEDVAANHWAAGYIAFCVEQGIINGMSATTFEPEGQLTGFQWAKMLLCAVGFGSQGEFTGNSWSLNTAKVAHLVGLFNGDLAGADHVALQRQQAMLYAFNVLTTVPQVTYAPGITGYIEGVENYKPVTDLGQTLGWSIYKLKSVTGIIVDNEALNAPATVVNAKAEYNAYAPNTVSVKANTGLDMMYHAARIWYVEGTKANTGVFVYDLAKVETTNCPTTLPAKDVYNIGKEVVGSVAYQYDKVDNSAVDAGTANVVLYYKWARLGARVEVKSTTVIDGVTVANSAIKTDISAINKDDPIIYLKGESTTTDNAGWHVYAPSATSGTVKSLSAKGVITLADGTTLSPSNIVGAGRAEALARIERILTGVIHDAPTYYFTLDTHGHYITMTEDPYRTVALYTGSWKLTSSHDAWSTSVQYAAQFVDVKTGAVKVVPVRNTWVANNASLLDKGYFDITDELFGDATYAPHVVDVSDNYYGGSYAIVNAVNGIGVSSYTFRAADTANRINVAVPSTSGYSVDGVRFNDETVTFIIVNGTGDTLTVDTYTGVAGLIEGYAKKTGLPITSVTLRNMALVVNDEAAGNKSASVIFAYDAATATGGVVFFPTDVEKWSLVTDSYYQYDLAYLNGEKSVGSIKISRLAALAGSVAGVSVNNVLNPDIERGFYFYTVGEDGFCDALTRVPLQSRAVFYSDTANKIAMADGVYWINGVKVASDCKVVDTRSGAGTTVDTIDALAKLVNNNYYTGAVQVFYMWTNDKINLIYVVDCNLGWIDFEFAEGMTDWTVNSKTSDEVYEDANVVIANDALEALDDGTTVDIAFNVTPAAAAAKDTTVEATVKDGKVTLPVHSFVKDGTKLADVTITGVTYKVTVTNKQTEFGVCYLNPTSDATNKGTTLDDDHNPIVVNVGDKIRLCVFRDNVPAGIEATIYLTGALDQDIKFQGSTERKYGWSAAEGFVPTSNSLVIEKVTAEFTLNLGEATSAPAMSYSFKSGDTNANADKITFTAVPGSAYEFDLYRTAAADNNGDGKLLKLTLSAGSPIYSINRYAAANTGAALNFKFTPAANNVTVSAVDWSSETLATT